MRRPKPISKELQDLCDLTGRKNFFRKLGFGPLLDNVEYLAISKKATISERQVEDFANNLLFCLTLSCKCRFKKTPTECVRHQLTFDLVDQISLLSKCDSKLSYIVQNIIINWMPTQLRQSLNDYMDYVLSNEDFRSYTLKFIDASSQADFIKNIVYPKINDSMFEISCSESSYCSACGWTYRAE